MESRTTAELELEFIKNIISDSRRKIEDSGDSAVVWGLIVIAGIMFTYIRVLLNSNDYIFPAWGIVLAFGWIYSFIRSKKVKNSGLPQTFALKVQDSLWIASGITMTMIGIVGSIQVRREISDSVPFEYIINSMAIAPMISLILGLAYFVTGYINSSKITVLIGYGWWAGGLFMFYWKSIHHFPLFAAMMLFFQVIPGIVCFKRSRKKSAGA